MAVVTGALIAAGVSSMITAWSGAEQSLNEAKFVRSQNAARIKKLNEQFQLDTQNMYNNRESINQQKFKNDILIQESKLEAQDAFSQAFAGSGVRGRSVDALEAQISGDVAKAHNANIEQSTKQQDRQFLGLMRQGQANRAEINSMNSFDVSASHAANDMATLSAGVSTFTNTMGAGGLGSLFSNFGGGSSKGKSGGSSKVISDNRRSYSSNVA